MKYNFAPTLLFILISVFSGTAFSQQSNGKIRFVVTEENGNAVSGLKSSDFQLSQGKKILQVTEFEEKTDLPLEVTVIIDASASQERMIPAEKLMAEIFISKVLKAGTDKVSIVKLAGISSIVQSLTGNLQQAKDQIRKIEFEPPTGYIGGGIIAGNPSVDKVQMAKGSTSIWDSIVETLKNFSDENKTKSRQIIVLISDGVNTYGDAKLKEAINASLKSRIPIYAIGVGDSKYSGVDKRTLEKLTGQSGGVLIIPKDKVEDFQVQIKQIEPGLRGFYEAAFLTDNSKTKDSLQEAEIKIVNSELGKRKLKIIQPKSFYQSN